MSVDCGVSVRTLKCMLFQSRFVTGWVFLISIILQLTEEKKTDVSICYSKSWLEIEYVIIYVFS